MVESMFARSLALGVAAFGIGFVVEYRRRCHDGDGGLAGAEVYTDTYSLDTTGDGVSDTVVHEEVAEIDTTGDGSPDAIIAEEVIESDLDGDGEVDFIEASTTVGVDIDGDGVPDLIRTVTTTAADRTGDGEFDDVQVDIDEVVIEGGALDEALDQVRPDASSESEPSTEAGGSSLDRDLP